MFNRWELLTYQLCAGDVFWERKTSSAFFFATTIAEEGMRLKFWEGVVSVYPTNRSYPWDVGWDFKPVLMPSVSWWQPGDSILTVGSVSLPIIHFHFPLFILRLRKSWVYYGTYAWEVGFSCTTGRGWNAILRGFIKIICYLCPPGTISYNHRYSIRQRSLKYGADLDLTGKISG